jgi:hypothetical protein
MNEQTWSVPQGSLGGTSSTQISPGLNIVLVAAQGFEPWTG